MDRTQIGLEIRGRSPRRASSVMASPTATRVPSIAASYRSVEAEREQPVTKDEEPFTVHSQTKRAMIVALISLAATFSPLSSTIYFPAQDAISKSLHLSHETVNLSITTYLIAQGISPSIWGTLAEVYGRRQILLYTLALYVGANIGLARATDSTMLLVFRLLQAAGSSSTISIGGGIISDITQPHERGVYMGWFSGMRQISMALGPVLGGVIAGGINFRAIFWFLTISSTLTIILLLFVLPETARHIAGNGSVPLTSIRHRPLIEIITFKKPGAQSADEEMARSVSKPIGEPRTLSWWSFVEPLTYIFEKDVACALFFAGCIYTSWSMAIATTTVLLQRNYGLSTIHVGLCFLANGVGCVAGSILSGKMLNFNYVREAHVWHHRTSQGIDTPLPGKGAPIPSAFPLENARLSDAPVYSAVTVISCVIFGWSLHPMFGDARVNTSLAVPLVATFALGFCATAVLNSNNTLMIDLVPGRSANATAINNLARCLMGAVGVSLVDIMINNIGSGWTGVIMAGLIAVGFVAVMIEVRYGGKWRGERDLRIALKKRANSNETSRTQSTMTLAEIDSKDLEKDLEKDVEKELQSEPSRTSSKESETKPKSVQFPQMEPENQPERMPSKESESKPRSVTFPGQDESRK